MKLLVGIRNEEQPGKYEDITSWFTNRFINVASRPRRRLRSGARRRPEEPGLPQHPRFRRQPARVAVGPALVQRRQCEGTERRALLCLCGHARRAGLRVERPLLHGQRRQGHAALQRQSDGCSAGGSRLDTAGNAAAGDPRLRAAHEHRVDRAAAEMGDVLRRRHQHDAERQVRTAELRPAGDLRAHGVQTRRRRQRRPAHAHR